MEEIFFHLDLAWICSQICLGGIRRPFLQSFLIPLLEDPSGNSDLGGEIENQENERTERKEERKKERERKTKKESHT